MRISIAIAAILQLTGATFPGCNDCKFNLRVKVISAVVKDEDQRPGKGVSDPYVTLYGVLVRVRIHIYMILSYKEFT